MKLGWTTAGAAAAAIAIGVRYLARRPRYDLYGKVVMIVGGSRGLGLQVAREAALRGAKVGLLARSGEELQAAADELSSRGTIVATSMCDVRESESLRGSVASIVERLGPVDVLVNDAGIIGVGPVDALTLDDYREAMEVNFFGIVHAVETVLPSMRARRAGRIVNITSIGGKFAVPHLLPYSASKFAAVGYSEGLRAELLREGIVVTTVVPGLMRTGSPRHAIVAGQTKREYALFKLLDALPFVSVPVAHAARVIVDACERGTAEAVVSMPAKFALLMRALSPTLLDLALEVTARVLPDGGDDAEHRKGAQSESAVTRSPLAALNAKAEQTQNQTM